MSAMPPFAQSLTLPALFALIPTAGCAPSFAHVESRDVASTGGLHCRAFFVHEREPIQHVVFVMNGTGTGSNAFVHPSVEDIVRARGVLYVTLDRPGIVAPFGDPAAAQINDAQLQSVTQEHMLTCAQSVIPLIEERTEPTAPIHLRGHSEGALIALYLYEDLLGKDPELAARFETLILSGTPLQEFREIIESQIDVISEHDGGELGVAVEECDWPIMKKSMGVSCKYLEDAYARRTGAEVFHQLAARDAPAAFHLFHGLQDWNAPVAPVRELEEWASGGPLDVHFTYYEGGHSGGDQESPARMEMRRLLSMITSP